MSKDFADLKDKLPHSLVTMYSECRIVVHYLLKKTHSVLSINVTKNIQRASEHFANISLVVSAIFEITKHTIPC